ncbi:MAG: hypothetical protein AMXMBFR57_22610 [Acidimicrobiia bacterium]
MRRIGLAYALGLLQVVAYVLVLPPGHALFQTAYLIAALRATASPLVVFAVLAPVATTLASWTQSPIAGSRHLELLVLALITGGLTGAPKVETRTAGPALIFAAASIAAGVAAYPTRFMVLDAGGAGAQQWTDLLAGYLVRGPVNTPLYFGLLAAECAGLVWVVERTIRSGLRFDHLVAGSLAGHMLAAAHSCSRVLNAAWDSADAFGQALWNTLLTVRTYSQYDVNAAASTFVLVTVAGVGLWHTRFRALFIAACPLMFSSLWLMGSRVAFVAGLVSIGAGALVRRFGVTARGMVLGAVAVVLISGTLLAQFWWYPSRRNESVTAALSIRQVLAEAGLAMVRDSPAFGVGPGMFLELSTAYGTNQLKGAPWYWPQANENSHNQVLQLLAETGAVGLSAFALLLITVCRAGIRRGSELPPGSYWISVGVFGTILTWFTGHPLLVPDAAFAFWAFAGILVAHGPASAGAWSLHWQSWVAAAILATIPLQADGHRARADLEHRGTGLSAWTEDELGRYRRANGQFSLYVATGRLSTVAIRLAAPDAAPTELTVQIGERIINRLVAFNDRWTTVELLLPPSRYRFEEVTLRQVADGELAEILVGKVTERSPVRLR